MKLDKLLFSDLASATSFDFRDLSTLNDTVVSFTSPDGKSDIPSRQVQWEAHFKLDRKPTWYYKVLLGNT